MKKALTLYFLLFLFQIPIQSNELYKWKPIHKEFDELVLQLEDLTKQYYDCMAYYQIVERMYQIARREKNPNLIVRAQYWDASLLFDANIDKSDSLVRQALQNVDATHYKYDEKRLLYLTGQILSKRNQYPQAYRILKEQEKYFTEIDDKLYAGNTTTSIGSILRRIGEYNDAQKYYLKADEWFKKGHFIEKEIKNRSNTGITKYHLGHPQEAVRELNALLEDTITQKDTVFLVNALTSLYFVSDSLYKKEKYAHQAYELSKHILNKTAQTYSLINVGACYIYRGKNDSALIYYHKALQLAEKNKDTYSITHSYYGLSAIYARLQMPDSAYYYLKTYNKAKEEATGYDKTNEINRYEMRIAIKQYENELQEASERIETHQRLIITIILVGIIICSVIGYIFWLSRKKEKIAKLLKESENRELNERLQRQQLQNEKYQMEINLKNRELTSNSMIAIEKNQMLRGLLKQIEELEEKKKLPINESRTLKQHIKSHLDTEDEWMSFKHHFEEVHPNFFKKLCAAHPNLSENELRLCAYVRIGMEAKQIAQMLSVLPETINTSRYRIRKKMQLAQDVVLENYLREI